MCTRNSAWMQIQVCVKYCGESTKFEDSLRLCRAISVEAALKFHKGSSSF